LLNIYTTILRWSNAGRYRFLQHTHTLCDGE